MTSAATAAISSLEITARNAIDDISGQPAVRNQPAPVLLYTTPHWSVESKKGEFFIKLTDAKPPECGQYTEISFQKK
jgi:hypothetical protein